MKNQEMQKKPKPKCVRVLSIPKMLLQCSQAIKKQGNKESALEPLNSALWGTVRNGYRERPTLKMTPPTIVQNFGILEEFWRRKQGFISNWLRILSKSIWRGGKMGRGKWYLDTSDKNCCYMGCIRPRHKRFSSAVSSDTQEEVHMPKSP